MKDDGYYAVIFTAETAADMTGHADYQVQLVRIDPGREINEQLRQDL